MDLHSATSPGTSPGERAKEEPANRKGFWCLILTQFQVAFNDNALRFLVAFLGLSLGLWKGERGTFVSLVGALFSAPFLLFSMAGGYLADRFSKRAVTISIKIFELGIMLLAFAGLTTKNLWTCLACVCLMGTHSALFGPSKYGLLPELLPERDLSWGNGILEMGTFLATLLGSGAGAVLYQSFGGRQEISGALLIALTLLGLWISFEISRVAPADAQKVFHANAAGEVLRQMRSMRTDRVLWLALLGNIYFWFLGMLVQQNIVLYGTDTLRATEIQVFYLMAALAIGIGIGSLAAGYLSGGKIEYGLIPLGSAGMAIFGVSLWWRSPSLGGACTDLALLGFAGGFFIVPISAILQHRPVKAEKGSVLATANLLSFLGIFLATGFYYVLSSLAHLSPRAVFLAGSLATAAATVYIALLLPDSLLRLALWALTHTIYRVRVRGADNLPQTGGALLVLDFRSWIDPLLLLMSTDRFIRFVMDRESYDQIAPRSLARALPVILIPATSQPSDLDRSLRTARATIRSGEIVCLFAHGSVGGEPMTFPQQFERIAKGMGDPVIPANVDNVGGSIFRIEKGRAVWKWPPQIPSRVTVSYGPAMPSSSSAEEVRAAARQLQSDAYEYHREWLRPLHHSLIRTAHRHPRRFAMADARVPSLRWGGALVRTILLARRLRTEWEGQQTVGILLPPSVAGALVNFAALLLGKVSVNINYTASDELVASCAHQAALQTVVTSRAFLDRVKIRVPGKSIILEDLIQKPSFGEKAFAFLLALAPATFIERFFCKRKSSLDDLAAIVFSSGSTGEPKGVLLTHYNIAANIEQVTQIVFLHPEDRLLGILPFFHSLGFTVGLWLPAATGIGVVYHASPVEAKAIGALVQRHGVTLLLATPTFLQNYTRRCSAEEFRSLRFVMAGAEKLPRRVAAEFEEKFNIRTLEGYGCTECAPVVAANTGDFWPPGFRTVRAPEDKVGTPAPGVIVRVVDPETLRPVPAGEPGLLLVRGPNVMQGYLNLPDQTAAALRDGWYVTGDIAFLDENGFIEITDRLSRFSKIGGEAVPHLRVEEELHRLADAAEQVFVVAGVADERKGERLVVLHTLPDEKLREILERLPAADFPNLWKPDPRQFFRIEAIPYLGTGKLDLRKVRDLALQFSEQPLRK